MNAASTGANAIAIGSNALATGSVAVGNGASAANGGAAFGDFAVATGGVANVSSATAIGNSASATTANAVAVGQSAAVLATGGSAFGANAVVQAAATNSVAIGQGSVASAPHTVSVGAPGGERRISNVAPGISPTDAATVGQLSSSASGLQSQINENDRRLRDGVAVAMAAGGVPAVPQGRKVGLFGNIATYDGHGAAGLGITGVVYETRGYQLQANGAVGVGFDTSVVGARGGVALFW